MAEVLSIIFWSALSFSVVDYVLGRTSINDPLRIALAVVFAVLFVLAVHTAF